MIQDAIKKLVEKKDISKEEAYNCIKDIMSGTVSEPLIASFLTALRMKGETIAEISGCAVAMREMAKKISSKSNSLIDTCGTGGDGSGTFNISTASAIIAASAGARVAKHGNRAVSSKSGSADVLKALGVNIEVSLDKVEKALDEIGITFLFAPIHHGAMKYAGPVRKALGIRTVFNILGPLTNPAGAKRQLLGVFQPDLTEVLGEVLLDLGSERAMVVHGMSGIDEISTTSVTQITELSNGEISTYMFDCESVGISKVVLSDLQGGDSERNKAIIEEILEGKPSAYRDIASLNAGAALFLSGIAESISDGVKIAQDSLDAGDAKKKLQQLVEYTNS